MRDALLLLLLLIPVFAFAEVHKCMTDEGHVTYSEKPCVAGKVSYDAKLVNVGDSSANTASIVRDAGGRYMTTGHADGQAMDFLIDTGATGLALPLEFASGKRRINCVEVKSVSTAGGTVNACTVIVSRLTVAGFDFYNVRADIVPTLKGYALFGQELMRQFTVTQRDGVMTLSR